MKARSTDREKLASKLDLLSERLAAAQADTKRVAAKRIATERRLAELGRQVAGLKRDLAEIAGKRTSDHA
jgi:hypothetical protein